MFVENTVEGEAVALMKTNSSSVSHASSIQFFLTAFTTEAFVIKQPRVVWNWYCTCAAQDVIIVYFTGLFWFIHYISNLYFRCFRPHFYHDLTKLIAVIW